MATSIIGIPTTRVSDSFIRERMLTQVQFDQAELFRIQTQLSTGRRFEAPSQDPVASQRVMALQSLLERKGQVKSNITTNQSYLAASDSAMGQFSSLMAVSRASALGVIGTTASDVQRAAAAQQISQAIQQLLDAGNQQFRGRYLFAGSNTLVQPFDTSNGGYIEYAGDEGHVDSYADLNLLFATNVNGSEAFGALSEQVRGIDLQPVLTYDTRLADLRGGAGITRGSIQVSDGHSRSTIDISSAETIGDVARLIRANPPLDRSLEVEVTATGLTIRLNPSGGFDPAADNLSVREVGGGSTAKELGILCAQGVGQGPLVGNALDPTLRKTTSLGDILGTRATAYLHFGGADSDLIVQAASRGEADSQGVLLNGVTVDFENDVAAGAEYAEFDPGDDVTPGSITVHFALGESRAYQVRDAINAAGAPFTAALDPLNRSSDGMGTLDKIIAGETAGGGGGEFDQASGLQIVNQGRTYDIDTLGDAETVEDFLNTLNGAGAGVLAEINQQRSGINLRSRVSGADFMIGELGGRTATQLGLRSFTDETPLSALNYGFGVHDYAGDPAAGIAGIDFTITCSDGTSFGVDITGARTIQDVRDVINASGAGKVRAELTPGGNGLRLVDDTPLSGPIVVTRCMGSMAAVDLGFIPVGENESESPSTKAAASGQVSWGEADNDLVFEAIEPGTYGNVQIIFQDDPAISKGDETAHYDAAAGTLTFRIDAGASDANDIIAALGNDPAASLLFAAELDGSLDPTNDGTGVVHETTTPFEMTGGTAEVLAGRDVNPLETDSVFNALLRLRHALETNDNLEAERAMGLLDRTMVNMTFSRAEVGAQQQGLDVMQDRLETEQIELKSVMSVEYDADFAAVVSELTARQIAYEASLKAAGQIMQFSLLDYL